MLTREERYRTRIAPGSVEALLLSYALARANVLLADAGELHGGIAHRRRLGMLRQELAARLDPGALAIELAEAERQAHDEAQSGRALLARQSRYRCLPTERQAIVAGVMATVTRAEAGLMRGLAHQLADARLQFRAATWRGDIATALKAEAAWERLAGHMTALLVNLAGQRADAAEAWVSRLRRGIDTDQEADEKAANHTPLYTLGLAPPPVLLSVRR